MPYKIVQTIERGKMKLFIVPSFWEENGTLWWPIKKTKHKLITDELSKPDKKQWKSMDCILKRTNIRTYQLAEAELTIMEEYSDTDVNDTEMVSPKTAVVQNQDLKQFEVMANELICDQKNQETPCTDKGNVTATENTIDHNDTDHENVVQILSTETFNFDQILENQKILSDKINKMLQIQAITLENQQKIVQELATQSVQFEEISVQLAGIKEGPSVTLLKDVNSVDTESFTLKPIENQRDLISLNQLLVDRAEKNKLQTHLSFLCSASKGDGQTCAYKLLDILFSRDFLCNCSWAGGSRGDRSKVALKDYKNVLKFFHGMIQTWDPTYTVQDNGTFFKLITKNSKQRNSMKNLRMSSKRSRKNKDNLDKQKNSRNKRQANNDNKETEGESIQIQEHAPNDESKEITEGESMQIQEHATSDESKETTEGESMQIQEHATSDESKETTEGESMQIQEHATNDESKETTEGQSMQIQEHATNDKSKETTKGESMQIKEHATNAESKEITEGECMQIQEQEKDKENIFLNYMSDDDIDGL